MNATWSLAFLPGGSEWVVILLVILLLFGAKRLPELARSLGKGISEFKKAMNEATNEITNVKNDVQSSATADPEPKKLAGGNPAPPAPPASRNA